MLNNSESEHHQTNLLWLACCALCYSLALSLTIHGASLWTDEAFSAYMACHRTLGSLVATLLAGDSSDLQMAIYYIYLHFWTLCFGFTEFALRAANIPFIVLFSFAFVWTSWRVVRSRWIWMAPACFPFLLLYGREVRAYFALAACSMVCFGGLLALAERPSTRERRYLPWLILSSLFLGATFHMLMLLGVFPMLLLAFVYRQPGNWGVAWTDWKPALQAFFLPFILLFAYIGWTFLRGTAYQYDKPGVQSMGSVFYRFLGLSWFGPDRHYDIPFRPYLGSIAAAGLVLLIALIGMALAGLRSKQRWRLICLSGVFALALLQVVALSVVSGQQADERHFSALAPLLLIVVLAALSGPFHRKISPIIALASALLLAGFWLTADARLLFLPEYRTEDFRAAIGQALKLHQETNADLALVGDPAAGAYYGLDLHGEAPCFPLLPSCVDGFNKVDWPRKAPAVYAAAWTTDKIGVWLSSHAKNRVPVLVIISRQRHPLYTNSAWWPILRAASQATQYPVHGFFLYLLKPDAIDTQTH
jgi:hypothetical protein